MIGCRVVLVLIVSGVGLIDREGMLAFDLDIIVLLDILVSFVVSPRGL